MEKLLEILNGTKIDIDFSYYLDIELSEYSDAEDLLDEIESQIQEAFNVDIIYYSRAIKYLTEYDPSLHASLSIAAEAGYTTENLSSEILASLLASQNLREEWDDARRGLLDELQELLDQLQEEEEEEE